MITKRCTVSVTGTPAHLLTLVTPPLPEHIPTFAIIVDVQLHLETRRDLTSITEEVMGSRLSITFEWPAEAVEEKR